MSILTASTSEYLGNTKKAAAMHVFKKTNQRDIRISSQWGVEVVSVFNGREWVDYDTWMENGKHYFLLMQ